MPWSEIERLLTGPREGERAGTRESPARGRKRQEYRPAAVERETGPLVPYAELHAHSTFSFLDGASEPAALLEEAARLRLHALALTDHDGLYGAVRLAEAAAALGEVKTVFGAELSLGLGKPQNGEPDPGGSHLLVLAAGQRGYHRLAGAITDAQLAPGAEKGRPVYDLDSLAEAAHGDWVVLTGCRKSAVRQALEHGGTRAAERELARLADLFGAGCMAVELFDTGDPLDSTRNDALFELAERLGLPCVATGVVHYARPDGHRLAGALAAVRSRRSLDELDGWLPAGGVAYLRSGAEMARRLGRYPGAIENTVPIAERCAFELRVARPRLPRLEVPDGRTPMQHLRELVAAGARERYGDDAASERVSARLEKELAVIERKDFPGYFLIVNDIVRFARSRGILCQGRGSAANSAVCFALGITSVDSIYYNLPFERFLSSLRPEEPDIDVDFDSDRREEVIQYVFQKYGRRNAAQVADVISYRPRNAVRDMAKALGHSPGQQDAWAKQVDGALELQARVISDPRRDASADARPGRRGERDDQLEIPPEVAELAASLLRAPRHLGIHSGGMVLTDRPVGEVCPIEHARMGGRTVLQWDKDDCEWMGLVKFDLLGLGILAALQYTFDLVDAHLGERWQLHTIPGEEAAVYDMLCRADAIGVFQVESRAQLGTLPRLKPRRFYDLVIEVALIRPGPIQGGAVHPYIRRRSGREEWRYLHPDLEPVLARTLGIPLFQEQVMQMAMAVGDCTAEDADLLRRAMGSKRGKERIDSLREKIFAGMARRGISESDAAHIYGMIEAFADFGFAESHALSFALLVYASAWLKLHYPAAYLAAMLRAQPMGFYSPQTLTADAVRHGVEVRRVDIQRSGVDAVLEAVAPEPAFAGRAHATGRRECLQSGQPPVPGSFDATGADDSAAHRRDGALAVRLGLAAVTALGRRDAERIARERDENGPYLGLDDLARRTALRLDQLEALATAGAFDAFGLSRRQALWAAGPASRERPGQLAGTRVAVQPPLLSVLTPAEQTAYDLWATGISPGDHPVRHVREVLDRRGVVPIARFGDAEAGRRFEAAGVVTHRQRPSTAGGVTFLNLEDETGLLNVIAGTGVWNRYRRVARESPALVVRGILERSAEGVVSLLADRFEPLALRAKTTSRDFR